MILGIDIGRVLISPDSTGGGDTSFIGGTLEAALATAPYDGMFEALPALVQHFAGRVWLVSKARSRVEHKTRCWLAHHRFFERTGIAPGHLRFCIERHQKADHCRELGVTHFIDDRLDVMGYLEGIVRHRFLFGPQKVGTSPSAEIVHLPSWGGTRPELFQP